MKINDRSRFPHPVLWAVSGDYARGTFHVEFEGQESLATGAVTLKYTGALEQTEISEIIRTGGASVGVFINCLETYYSRLFPITLPTGELQIHGGLLHGRVILRPVIWTNSVATIDNSQDIHPEFGVGRHSIPRFGILAVGDEAVIEIGREKLAKIESVFALAENNDVPLNQFAVYLDDEKVQIHAPRATYEKIFRLRSTSPSLAILLNSVYLPAVIEVLSCLKASPDDFEDRRWHRVFMAKLNHLGINIESEELLPAAQRILNSPFQAIPDDLDFRS